MHLRIVMRVEIFIMQAHSIQLSPVMFS